MKIREGFVSNSSSSSFVIAFKKEADLDTLLEEKINVKVNNYWLEEENQRHERFDFLNNINLIDAKKWLIDKIKADSNKFYEEMIFKAKKGFVVLEIYLDDKTHNKTFEDLLHWDMLTFDDIVEKDFLLIKGQHTIGVELPEDCKIVSYQGEE